MSYFLVYKCYDFNVVVHWTTAFTGYLNSFLQHYAVNAKLAEFTGAMIGDGCLSLVHSRSENRIRKIALLTGNIKHDVEYYEQVIRPIIRTEFNVSGYLQMRHKRNCVYLVMSSGVFDFLSKTGLPVGLKTNLQIPKVILQNKEYSKACLRGIFDTDGSIYRRYSKRYFGHTRVYDHMVIQFKLASKKVIEQIKQILDGLDIITNKIIQESNSYVLRITTQESVKRFMEIIRPSSRYHVERYINRCSEFNVHGSLAQLVRAPAQSVKLLIRGSRVQVP